jgi:hypothetical protein
MAFGGLSFCYLACVGILDSIGLTGGLPGELETWALRFSLPAHYLEDLPVIGFPVHLGIGFGYAIAHALNIHGFTYE